MRCVCNTGLQHVRRTLLWRVRRSHATEAAGMPHSNRIDSGMCAQSAVRSRRTRDESLCGIARQPRHTGHGMAMGLSAPRTCTSPPSFLARDEKRDWCRRALGWGEPHSRCTHALHAPSMAAESAAAAPSPDARPQSNNQAAASSQPTWPLLWHVLGVRHLHHRLRFGHAQRHELPAHVEACARENEHDAKHGDHARDQSVAVAV